jgi:hypothetical protein
MQKKPPEVFVPVKLTLERSYARNHPVSPSRPHHHGQPQ